MSNVPPPPPGSQPPPPSNYGIANPQPTVAFQPAPPAGDANGGKPAKAGRSKGLLAGVGVLVLAALGAGAFFLLKDDDNGGGVTAVTETASKVMTKLLDEGDKGTAFAKCPYATFDDLAALAPANMEADLAAKGDQAVAFQNLKDDKGVTFARHIVCNGKSGETVATVLVGEPFQGVFEESLQKALSGFTINFEKPEDVKGGTLQTYCSKSNANVSSCAAQWFTKDLRIGVVSTSPKATAVDATTWLKAIIDKVVAGAEKATV